MRNRPSSYDTESIVTPVSTCRPSWANASATTALASGSSGARMRSAISSTVTRTPNRASACAISAPIAPPPITTSDPGTDSIRITSRLVQYGVSASPSIGGTAGAVPGLSTTPRDASKVSPPTSTVRGPVSRAWPRTNRAPAFSSRSTATWSSQLSVASSRIRSATSPQSGRTSASPASPPMRRPSASTSAARIIILLGMQP